MNNTNKKYVIVGVVIIILLGIIVWQANRTSNNVGQALAPATSEQTSGVPAKTPAAVPAKTVSSGSSVNNYVNYATNLAANQQSCKDAATKQGGQLYGTLEQSNIQSYYNTKTGLCYARITGSIRPAYSTTTIGEIYFRDVSTSVPIAECTDAKGMTLLDGDWACVNKITGQAISKAEFNTVTSQYTVQ
jgi:hypothetical protein